MVNSQDKPICPKCGARSLSVEPARDNTMDLVCLNLDCDYAENVVRYAAPDAGPPFEHRLKCLDEKQLAQMARNLRRSVSTLSDQARRTAQRQLALVQTELENRRPRPAKSLGAVPPQFATPEAKARRIARIRDYHRQRRSEGSRGPDEAVADRLTDLARNLRQDAARHEQAARDYAQMPEMVTLHVDHMARAFELKRVLDLLGPCLHSAEKEP